jgi:hypothetical protein
MKIRIISKRKEYQYRPKHMFSLYFSIFFFMFLKQLLVFAWQALTVFMFEVPLRDDDIIEWNEYQTYNPRIES